MFINLLRLLKLGDEILHDDDDDDDPQKFLKQHAPPLLLSSSGAPSLQLGPLSHQVHREHQPEDLPRVQLGLRPGLGGDHLLLRWGDPLLPQPHQLRGVLLAMIQAHNLTHHWETEQNQSEVQCSFILKSHLLRTPPPCGFLFVCCCCFLTCSLTVPWGGSLLGSSLELLRTQLWQLCSNNVQNFTFSLRSLFHI